MNRHPCVIASRGRTKFFLAALALLPLIACKDREARPALASVSDASLADTPPAVDAPRPIPLPELACPDGSELRSYPGDVVACTDASGKLHGSYAERTNDNLLLRRTYENGVQTGTETIEDEKGAMLSEFSIAEGQRHGSFKEWTDDGELARAGEMKRNQLHGVERRYRPAGDLTVATTWKNGVKAGPAQRRLPDGGMELVCHEAGEVVWNSPADEGPAPCSHEKLAFEPDEEESE